MIYNNLKKTSLWELIAHSQNQKYHKNVNKLTLIHDKYLF